MKGRRGWIHLSIFVLTTREQNRTISAVPVWFVPSACPPASWRLADEEGGRYRRALFGSSVWLVDSDLCMCVCTQSSRVGVYDSGDGR